MGGADGFNIRPVGIDEHRPNGHDVFLGTAFAIGGVDRDEHTRTLGREGADGFSVLRQSSIQNPGKRSVLAVLIVIKRLEGE